MESNLSTNHIDRIDAFEKNSLSPEELQSFQNDMNSNEELAEHFNYIQQLKAALQLERKQRLIDQFNNWDESTTSRPQNNNASRIIRLNPRRKWMALAASFLFFALAGWWVMTSTNNSSQENHLSLFDQYFSPYPCTTLQRSNSKEKGFVLDSSNKFELAKDHLKNSKDPDAQFYLANSYLALNESQNAISALKEYKGEKFRSVLDWYLALSYLQANQMDEAVTLLNQLVAANGDYSLKAAEVLQALAK